MSLYSQILEVSMPRTTKADIVDYYQSEYRWTGKGGGKQTLVHALSALTGIKSKNLEKRFDVQRLHNEERRNEAQYTTLGETLPPKAPPGLHIEGVIYVKYSDECVDRWIDEDITGKAAQELTNAAYQEKANATPLNESLAFEYVAAAYDSGGQGDIHSYNPPQQGDCAPPELTITPLED